MDILVHISNRILNRILFYRYYRCFFYKHMPGLNSAELCEVTTSYLLSVAANHNPLGYLLVKITSQAPNIS